MFKSFDKWIDRLEGKNEVLPAAAESYQITAANIIANLPQKAYSLLFAGTADRYSIQQVCERLKEMLPQEITCHAAGRVSSDAESVRLAAFCDGVVLVEKRGVSVYPQIEQEIQAIKDLGKEIIGFVLVE